MEDFHRGVKVGQAAKSHFDWANIHADAFSIDSERPDPNMVCKEC